MRNCRKCQAVVKCDRCNQCDFCHVDGHYDTILELARDQIKLAAQEQENEGTKFRWYRSPLFVSYLDKAPLTHKEKQVIFSSQILCYSAFATHFRKLMSIHRCDCTLCGK